MRHRVTQQVRIDVLRDPCLGCHLLDKLLKASRSVVATARASQDGATLTAAQVEPQRVGQAPEYGHYLLCR